MGPAVTVLDVGCGSAAFATALCRKVGNGSTAILFDLPDVLNECRERVNGCDSMHHAYNIVVVMDSAALIQVSACAPTATHSATPLWLVLEALTTPATVVTSSRALAT